MRSTLVDRRQPCDASGPPHQPWGCATIHQPRFSNDFPIHLDYCASQRRSGSALWNTVLLPGAYDEDGLRSFRVMERLSLASTPPPGPGPGGQNAQGHPPMPLPLSVPQLPAQMFTTAAQLLDLTDSELSRQVTGVINGGGAKGDETGVVQAPLTSELASTTMQRN